MIDKKTLADLAHKFRIKALKDYDNFQQTGITRFDTSRRRNEDLADAFDMAVNAADEHNECVNMKLVLSEYAALAKCALADQDLEKKAAKLESLARDLKSYGIRNGFIRPD